MVSSTYNRLLGQQHLSLACLFDGQVHRDEYESAGVVVGEGWGSTMGGVQ